MKIFKQILILLLFLVISGIVGIFFINNVSWDFINYHYYNGWAFLNNRLNVDLFPAMFRSYFNPLLDAGLYYMAEKLNTHPYIFLFLSGFKWGFFMYLSFVLFNVIFKGTEKNIYVVFCTLMTIISPIIMLCIDSSYIDIQIAIPAFIGFIIFIKTFFDDFSGSKVLKLILCGVLIGISVGLKYSMGVFGLAVLVCTLAYYKQVEKPVKTAIILTVSMFFGFLITNGWWMYLLWKHFGNPLFPYFNNIFHSPLCDTNSIYGYEFEHIRAKNIFELLFGPIRNTMLGNIGFEYPFYDFKIPLTFISVLLYFILSKFSDIKESLNKIVDYKIFNVIILFTAVLYYSNSAFFGNLRYALLLFPLGSIIIAVTCYLWSVSKNSKVDTYMVLAILALCITSHVRQRPDIFGFAEFIILLFAVGILIYMLITKRKDLSDSFKNTGIILSLVMIICLSKLIYPFNALNFWCLNKVLSIGNAGFKDNSTVICGTMLASFIIPKQNKNVSYIGFSIPEKYAKEGFWNTDSPFKNKYFADNVIGEKITEILKNEKDVYYVYSYDELGFYKVDMRILLKTLNKYSNGKIKRLNNCKDINYIIFSELNPWKKFVVCKIK
ncbi:hypothetical protein IKQ21_07065 [bacterium]|nr:hypothetical protein [bacterium]